MTPLLWPMGAFCGASFLGTVAFGGAFSWALLPSVAVLLLLALQSLDQSTSAALSSRVLPLAAGTLQQLWLQSQATRGQDSSS